MLAAHVQKQFPPVPVPYRCFFGLAPDIMRGEISCDIDPVKGVLDAGQELECILHKPEGRVTCVVTPEPCSVGGSCAWCGVCGVEGEEEVRMSERGERR